MINPLGVLGLTKYSGCFPAATRCPARAESPLRPRPRRVRNRRGCRHSGARTRGLCPRPEGDSPCAEAAGFGATCDAYRITDGRPDGTSATRAIEQCLRDADAVPTDVGYVNAHGTGTRMNDVIETLAIRRAFGPHADAMPVSSTKSMVGHLLAGAGAVEFAATVLAIRDGFLPPTINYETPDPECDLDYIPNRARAARIDAAVSNSFGFGGQNCVYSCDVGRSGAPRSDCAGGRRRPARGAPGATTRHPPRFRPRRRVDRFSRPCFSPRGRHWQADPGVSLGAIHPRSVRRWQYLGVDYDRYLSERSPNMKRRGRLNRLP